MSEEKKTSILTSKRDISLDIRTISSDLVYTGIPPSLIELILNGNATPNLFYSYDQYDKIYKIRHDAIHSIICHSRGLPFGEKPVKELIEIKDDQFKMVENQSPDIFEINGRRIKIVEITISSIKDAEARKTSKYNLLIKILERNNYDVEFEIIVVSNIQGIPDREMLNQVHGLSFVEINLITDILTNVSKVLQNLHQTENGTKWLLKFRDVISDDFVFQMTNDDILQYYKSLDRKPFNDEKDLINILNSDEQSYLTPSDRRVLDMLIDHAIKDESPYEKSSTGKISEFIQYHKLNSNRSLQRSILPIPFLTTNGTDSSMRHVFNKDTLTDLDQIEITKILGDFSDSKSSYWSKFGDMNGFMAKVKLTPSDRILDALEGPGRKSFLSKLNCPIEIINKEREDRRMWLNISSDYSDIESISKHFSIIDNKDDIQSVKDFVNISGPGINYVRLFQSIMREICVNSSRKNRNHQYIIRPTGFIGVYVMIYPGPKLRTGENVSQIFYRVIHRRDVTNFNNYSNSWVFRKNKIVGNFSHTKWASVDANRLDHYIRCVDKILMAYGAYLQFGKNDIITNMKTDTSNTLGMIILTYLEDRRSTSKLLQELRYVVMGSLSLYKYWDDIVEKLKEPIRSSLQAYYINRIIYFIKNYDSFSSNLLSNCKFGKANLDPSSMGLSDKLAGSIILMPRILTIGPKINFQQMLCEMYFCMLFNKNQDDPTHSSQQILTKILEGDENLRLVKETTKLHTGKQHGDIEDIKNLLNNPQKNQFSRRIIQIASKLQSTSEYNNAPSGSAYQMSSQNKFLNKSVDDFSTFKSSSQCLNKVFDGNLYLDLSVVGNDDEETEELKRYAKQHKREILKNEFEIQNPRRRCIEGTIDLIKHNKWKSFDLLPEITDTNIFQVFKKNQIGGVREIIILDIKKRILINIMESFSRLVCHEDGREMLTHGDKKFTLFRDLLRDLKRKTEKRLIMNYNFDKTKWGPSFMPIQFLYMFLPYKKKIPDLFRFILVSLMNHTNKECLIPEKLIQSWSADPYNTKHSDKLLQNLKEQFMMDKKMTFINESNMGQGILHYTSSLFHLCVVSLRDYLYYGMCSRKNINPGELRDLISSDDSYTAQALPMDSKELAIIRIKFFLRAQWVSERLMNVWTSKSKSSISLLVYEFNSLFGSNLGVFPTLFKFAIASVQPVNTDSFYRMVKESYNQSRQVVENGGSLELYTLAQLLNKQYAEQIYHTYKGGQNDFRQLDIKEENMPYHLGYYPVGDPATMLMLGPEYHNYDIFSRMFPKTNDGVRLLNKKKFTYNEIQIWNNSHSMVDINPDVLASLNSQDNLFIGLTRIEADIGPIKKVLIIRRQMEYSWDDIQEKIAENPMLLFRKPENIDECKLKIYLKMYQNGVSEALRTTAASIYYGRVAATVSANCFYIPFVTRKVAHSMEMDGQDEKYFDSSGNVIDVVEFKKNHTYLDSLRLMIDMNTNSIDINSFYSYIDEYEIIKQLYKPNMKYHHRSVFETQNIRSLKLNKIRQQILNPIPNLLHRFWFKRLKDDIQFENSELRDWITLKEITGIIQDSYVDTMASFKGNEMDKLRQLIMIVLRVMSHHTSPMKAIIFGPSSNSYDTTYQTLLNHNKHYSLTNESAHKVEHKDVSSSYYNDLFLLYNYFILSLYSGQIIRIKEKLDVDIINQVFRDPGVSPSTKRRILMMCVYSGLLGDVNEWTDRTKTILHVWELRQKTNDLGKTWYGPFKIRLQQGSTKMLIHNIDGPIKIFVNTFKEPKILEECLIKCSELVEMKLEDFIQKVSAGQYKITQQGVKNIRMINGFKITRMNVASLSFNPGEIIFEDKITVLYDVQGKKLMATTTGLIACESNTDMLITNFGVDGSMYFHDLMKMNIFSQNFSVDYLSKDECVNLLDDLEIRKPNLTKQTIERLSLKDYDLRTPDEYDQFLLESIGYSESNDERLKRIMEEKKQKDLEPPDGGLIDMFLEDDTLDEKGVFDLFMTSSMDFNEQLLNVDVDISLITMNININTNKPVALLNLVLHIKELLIIRCITDMSHISKRTLDAAFKLTNSIGVYYSILFVYDKIYQHIDMRSPTGVKIDIEPSFYDKFLK